MTVGNLATSTCSSVFCLDEMTDHMPNKLLHIKSAARYKHRIQCICMEVINEYIATVHQQGKPTIERFKIIPFVIKLSCWVAICI
jgi:hypothetical protein